MRASLTFGFSMAVPAVANAHSLAGDESVASQLGHQLFSLHHLPLVALLVVGGILVLRRLYGSGRIDKTRTL